MSRLVGAPPLFGLYFLSGAPRGLPSRNMQGTSDDGAAGHGEDDTARRRGLSDRAVGAGKHQAARPRAAEDTDGTDPMTQKLRRVPTCVPLQSASLPLCAGGTDQSEKS